MASSNSSSTSSKTKKNAQDALDRFKMEVASEIGVNLKEGYNGDLTSAEAGSVGGNMVKKMIRKQGRTDVTGWQLGKSHILDKSNNDIFKLLIRLTKQYQPI